MDLVIDTGSRNIIKLALKKGSKFLVRAEIAAEHSQGEKLLPSIEILLNKFKDHGKLKSIVVADKGEGFSSLRIGVSVANALAYALNVPLKSLSNKSLKPRKDSFISPRYSHPPKIGKN